MSYLITEAQKVTIQQALRIAVTDPIWKKSTFLTAVGKQVAQLQEAFETLLKTPAPSAALHQKQTQDTEDSPLTPIFIGLYAVNGSDLKTWEHILCNLPDHLASRPIYGAEEQIITTIKTKVKKENEAYLAIQIDNQYLVTLPQDKTPTDKLHHPLLTLKGKPLPARYEGTFVHSSGRYHFKNGHLTLITQAG